MNWEKFTKTAWFRKDFAYAGKDHTKGVKTFIALSPPLADGTLSELKGFKSVEAARKAADRKWPLEKWRDNNDLIPIKYG